MADQLTPNPNRPLDWAGDVVPGAKATFYASGTTTPLTVYQDAAATIPHTQPIEADSNGVLPAVFCAAAAKVIITDADDVTLPGYPLDPVPRHLTDVSGASTIPFEPTDTIPVTNVQSAIERVQTNLATSLAASGVGVVTTPLLASLNATDIEGGWYRFDGTTTGTFPAGVTAATGGTVEVKPSVVGFAAMELIPATGDRRFQRVMQSLTWGAWDEVIVLPAATAGDLAYRGASGWERLAKGAAYQGLRMKSDVTVPEWGAGIFALGGFDGSLATPIISGDVNASVTKSSTGVYVVAFGVAAPSTAFQVFLQGTNNNFLRPSNKTTAGFTIRSFGANVAGDIGITPADDAGVSFIVVRA